MLVAVDKTCAYPHPLSIDSSNLLFFTPTATRIQPSPSNQKIRHVPKFNLPQFKRNTSLYCSYSSSSVLEDDDDHDVLLDDGSGSQLLSGNGVWIEMEKLGRNSRRVRYKIEIDASLDTVWYILTDYENLADVVPSLVVSRVMERKDNFVRLYQIGQQTLALGIKYNAKGVLDCYEKELQKSFHPGKKGRLHLR